MAKAIPEGLHSVTPALTVDGCAEAIETWKKAFGAEELMRAPDPTGKKIWHASVRIGDSVVFCNDYSPEMMPNVPRQARLWIYLGRRQGVPARQGRRPQGRHASRRHVLGRPHLRSPRPLGQPVGHRPARQGPLPGRDEEGPGRVRGEGAE